MIEYTMGKVSEKEDIIDFINYVFSQAHCPHEFKSLIPKSYADHIEGLGAMHYLAKKDGKIKAVIANRITKAEAFGKKLTIGFIGNVSVHPHSRGEGFMKKLLNNALDDAKCNGTDMMILAGQRQRYGYFGFEPAGSDMKFTISKSNIHHCFSDIDYSEISFRELKSPEEIDYAKSLYDKRPYRVIRDKEEYLDILHTFNAKAYSIYKNEKMIGYIQGMIGELILENEKDLPSVLKAFFEKNNLSAVDICTNIFEKERSEYLTDICENANIIQKEMIKVLKWKPVLEALLTLKSHYVRLADGTADIIADGESLRITVDEGVPTIECVSESGNSIILDGRNAIRKIFNISSFIMPDSHFKNWFPIPLIIDAPDTF